MLRGHELAENAERKSFRDDIGCGGVQHDLRRAASDLPNPTQKSSEVLRSSSFSNDMLIEERPLAGNDGSIDNEHTSKD
jgi:hypothetical protein